MNPETKYQVVGRVVSYVGETLTVQASTGDVISGEFPLENISDRIYDESLEGKFVDLLVKGDGKVIVAVRIIPGFQRERMLLKALINL